MNINTRMAKNGKSSCNIATFSFAYLAYELIREWSALVLVDFSRLHNGEF